MRIPWKLIFLADDLSASSAIFNHAIFSSISPAIAAETVQGAAAGEATGRADSASALLIVLVACVPACVPASVCVCLRVRVCSRPYAVPSCACVCVCQPAVIHSCGRLKAFH